MRRMARPTACMEAQPSGKSSDTPLGYSKQIALRREQCNGMINTFSLEVTQQ
jgi:hypothetical protein